MCYSEDKSYKDKNPILLVFFSDMAHFSEFQSPSPTCIITRKGQKYFLFLKFHYIFIKTFIIWKLHQNLIHVCYHYESFRIYAKPTQDSRQMFLLVLFYIFFESQFMNITR